MRPTNLVALVAPLLLALGCAAQASDSTKAPAPAPPAVNATPNPQWTVEGVGVNTEEADKDAFELAQKEVAAYLDAQQPRWVWKPDANYVRTLRKGEPVRETQQVQSGLAHKAKVTVEITPQKFQEMLEEDRKAVVTSRQLLLVKILAVVVSLLTAVAGYVKLDELTKGYYSGLLKLLAVGLVGGVGAGVWFLS
jgi:hypothetical protein